MGPEAIFPLAIAGSAVLALANGGLWLWGRMADRSDSELEERFERLVRGETLGVREQRSDLRGVLTRFGRQRVASGEVDPEVRVLLARAGYPGRDPVALFTALRILLPVGLTGAGCLLTLIVAGAGLGLVFVAYVTFTVGYLVPKSVLRSKATSRATRIREEVAILTHLLRVLYDCGLSTEQALMVFGREQAHVLPDLSIEVGEVLRQVSAGQDLGSATREVSERLDLPAFTDLFALLRQIDQYGGSVQEPLLNFTELLEDRERTRLQEKIGQLSAKLTAVMVLFLLPALLTFVAGPGFISVIRALSEMQ